MNKKIIYMMVGVPASGKTTFATAMADESNGAYVSRDEIRYVMTNSRKVNMKNEMYVLNAFCNEIVRQSKEKDIIFADATHASLRGRFAFLHGIAAAAEKQNIDFGIYQIIPIIMETPFEICMKINSQRIEAFRVPEEDMINYYAKCKLPSKTEIGVETWCPIRYFYNPQTGKLESVTFEDKKI